MVNGDSSGQNLKFSELIVSLMGGIFRIDLLEEEGIFLSLSPFFDEGFFAVDLLDLFWLEVVFGLQFCYFRKFFVYVAHLLLEGPKERFILFIYNLGFCFGVFAFLWLWFF